MIKIDEDLTTIHLTRGDSTGIKHNKLAFKYPIYNFQTQEEEDYEFLPTDKIAFICMKKKGYTEEEILRKEYTLREIGYTAPATVVEIPLTAEETKRFPLINKKQTYWYDLVLNDTTTILGFDDDGAKKIIVYPEGEEE